MIDYCKVTMNILEYFSTYDYLFESATENYENTFTIPYVWQCWLQGHENAPKIVRTCLKSIKNEHGNLKIKILDVKNIHNFITIPKHILEKYAKGYICHAHFTDYVRVALLAKYGGTWIDATVFLTDKIPQNIFEQEFFAFKFPPWCDLNSLPALEIIFSEKTRKLDMRAFSNWFMHAKSNNRLIKLIKVFLEEYWARENAPFDYFMFHFFATYIILKDAHCGNIFKNMFEINSAYAHLLQQCLLQSYDANLYAQIQASSPIHKLMHNFTEEIQADTFITFLMQQ